MPQPSPGDAPPTAHGGALLHDALARLLQLLQNNNMKALAAAEALAPSLAVQAEPALASALLDAVATLRFDDAARLTAALIAQDTQETQETQERTP